MADHPPNVQVLQASVDPEGESEFRLLVDNVVKYIIVNSGLYEPDEMCFIPTFLSLIPPLPPGNWNKGYISRDSTTKRAHFASVEEVHLPGVQTIWHSTLIDHLELRMERKLRSSVYEVTCPRFSSTVVAKFARFPWEVPQLDAETMVYEWINGQELGPEFLGHLTEGGRVIGFVMSLVADFHHATLEDLAICHIALSKLHSLGIKHGDINKHNFLVQNGKAMLIDFDRASRLNSPDDLDEEFQDLQRQLTDVSGRGGRVVETGYH